MKLSIITVCYNSEKYIAKTIESILNQTIPVYEYIIVDGGSQDKTLSIIESYNEEFKQKGIYYSYTSEKDYGISDAFNKGIKRSSGDLVGLVNADDELIATTNEILSEQFNKQYDIYYGNCIWNDTKNGLRFVSKPKEQNSNKLGRLLYEMVIIHPATYITRNAYEKYGLYDVSFRYCMDEELLYRMYRKGAKFNYIDKTFTVFKAGGVSDSNPKKVFDEANRIPLMYGEPKLKVLAIEEKKLARNTLARIAKKIGLYRVLKKQESKV